MQQPSASPRLTFEDAMAVHVLRSGGLIYSELTRIFGANPARFHEILCGKLFPGSWQKAVENLAAGADWHPEVAQLVHRQGRERVLTAVVAANPARKQYLKERRRLLRSAPIPIGMLRAS